MHPQATLKVLGYLQKVPTGHLQRLDPAAILHLHKLAQGTQAKVLAFVTFFSLSERWAMCFQYCKISVLTSLNP